jgi:hypothetical protein
MQSRGSKGNPKQRLLANNYYSTYLATVNFPQPGQRASPLLLKVLLVVIMFVPKKELVLFKACLK